MNSNNAIVACCEAIFTKQLDKSELERRFIKTYGITYEECNWTHMEPIEKHVHICE